MSVSSSFQRLISRIEPSVTELASATQHANTIKTRLQASFRLKKLMIIGSYSRKSYISGSSDIDVFAVLARNEMRWGGSYVNSTTALDNLRKDLEGRYPSTTIYKDVHAIVVDFSGTRSHVDVVPGFFAEMTSQNWPLYSMPDGAGRWMRTCPELHNVYIKQKDDASGGKLRRSAQLIKFWRECRSPTIPLTSFHIEMLLAANGVCEGIKSYADCITETLQLLAQRECQALRDPLGIAGDIFATRSYQQRETTLRSIVYSRDHAKAALRAEQYGNVSEAKRQWDIVFNGKFPA